MSEFALTKPAIDLLLLEVIGERPSYGYEITQTVLSRSGKHFEIKEGALYPALHRLERAGLLQAEWGEASGRERKYYRLTAQGKKELVAWRDAWRQFAEAIEGVLDPNAVSFEGGTL